MKKQNKMFRLGLFGVVLLFALSIVFVLHSKAIGVLLNPLAFVSTPTQAQEGSVEELQLRENNKNLQYNSFWSYDDSFLAKDFDGGDGTENNPWLISSPEQLALMAYRVNNGGSEWGKMHYWLNSDIDLTGHFWNPIGVWENNMLFSGLFDGRGYVITNMLALTHYFVREGSMAAFFGVLGDGAYIRNVVFKKAITMPDPSLVVYKHIMTLSILVAHIEGNANVYIVNNYIEESTVYSPHIGKEYIERDIAAGVFVGMQFIGSGSLYIDSAFARMSGVMLNTLIDKTSWELDGITVVNRIGGMVGEARWFSITNSSFDGVIGVELIRINRNMDNWRYIYAVGGIVGNVDIPKDKTSEITNVDIGGSIYVDTFGKDEYNGRYNDERDIEWVADVRYIGGLVGSANGQEGNGNLLISDTQASVFVDAPDADEIITPPTAQDKELLENEYERLHAQPNVLLSTPTMFDKSRDSQGSGLQGPPVSSEAYLPLLALSPIIVGLISFAIYSTVAVVLALIFGIAATFLLVTLTIVVAVIVAIAIVVLAILFAYWAGGRPKWESHVHLGSAIGSDGRKGITINNVDIANSAVHTNTLFSNNDKQATIINSSNTLPTKAMIIDQPQSQTIEGVGEMVDMKISGVGTIMGDGTKGVNSFLKYQWYYNTIDSNQVTDDTIIIEGATSDRLRFEMDWIGSRYYFATITNQVLQFIGTNPTVTARVGNRDVSAKPAVIVQQPQDSTILINNAGKLSVQAEATGTMTYQWIVSKSQNMSDSIVLTGAVDTEYFPVHSLAGYYYYQVVIVTSVSASSGEAVRAETRSVVAKLTVQAKASQISILAQPTDSITVARYQTAVLGVQIDLSTVNGQVSYQWYKNVIDSNDSGLLLEGQTNQSILVDTMTVDTVYYYVVASNTVGDSVTTVTSDVCKVQINDVAIVEVDIVQQPIGGSAMIGYSWHMTILATANNAVVSYQWYENTTLSNVGGTKIDSANLPYFDAMSNIAITKYYYVEIDSVTGEGGKFRAVSNPVQVQILDPNQRKLQVLSVSKDAKVQQGELQSLSVSVEDRSGSMSYQWYESLNADGSQAIAIQGAVGNKYMVSSQEVGTKYYFVQIKNACQVATSQSAVDGSVVYGTYINSASSLQSFKAIRVDFVKNNIVSNNLTIMWIAIACILVLMAVAIVLVLFVAHTKRLKFGCK
ncbi:MAG: hypothetical protein FWF56_02405 [Firmicutes bacterium]|nr:hypothetical protein [Bacillota bacterium]MCL1954175.1 hypothetical protein [Bacillota bacterium]